MIVFLAVLYVLVGLAFAFFTALLADMDDEAFCLRTFVSGLVLWPYYGFLLATEAYEYYKEKNREW